MKFLLRLSWRDISRNRRFTLLFLVNLALGLAGFMVIGSFSGSLNRYLDGNLKEILTADLVLQSSRPLTKQEIEISRAMLQPEARISQQISFYSMVKGSTVAKLAQIVAIDGAYPLYGSFRYTGSFAHSRVLNDLQQERKLLMSRETARTFGLQLGDTLKIGQAEYQVAFFYEQDPEGEFTALELAPKIYLSIAQLGDSGLIRFGSRITYKRFFRLSASSDAAAAAVGLNKALAAVAGENGSVRIVTTKDVNRRLGRVVGYFGKFLGLASMVALFLAGMSAAYLFREHLQARLKETAIMLCLGASRRQCLLLHAGQLSVLGFLAACMSIFLGWWLLPLFGRLFTGIIPPNLHLMLDPISVIITLVVGTIGSLLFCLPVYLRLFTVQPLQLLHEQRGDTEPGIKGMALLGASLLPALAMLVLLAASLSGSLYQGALFTAGLVVLVVIFSLIAGLLLNRCRHWSRKSGLTWKIVWRNLHRNRLSTGAVFVAIATAVLLVNLVPQVENGLMAEIGRPEGMELPVFFLIDIQEEQQQPLRAFFQGSGHELSSLAPMVRGRIVSVNSVPFSKWRQQQSGVDAVFRRTEFNFSSREQLDASETVVKGLPVRPTPWSWESGQPFDISMEEQFSERLGVTLGDRMVVDIQGIELEGQIVNLRKVRWNSFQPNFFMLLQKGVLDDAPKTYLASISRVAPEEKIQVVNRLAERFANISVIDVTRTVELLGDITAKLTRSLRFMAWLAMATGVVAVVSIARQEALRREREINLLRVLGAGVGRIRMITMMEFALLGGAAALTAILLSYGCSYTVAWLLFDRIWQFQWQSGLLLLGALPITCAMIAFLAIDSVLRRKPVVLLS